MRRFLWAGGAILVAAIVAVPLWLAFDGESDGRRTAALGPTSTGAAPLGTLTLVGPKFGTLAIEVESFTFDVTSPRDPATGAATGSVRYGPLQIGKAIDATSPTLFKLIVNNDAISSATLELRSPGGEGAKPGVFASYEFTNAKVRMWHDATSEAITISHQGVSAKAGPAAPPPSDDEVIGHMTYQGTVVPITGFDTGLDAPYDAVTGALTGKRRHNPASAVRPLDGIAPTALANLQGNAPLGQITVELQRSNADGKEETYATYTYGGARAAGVANSGEAGEGSSQRLEFVYTTIEVSVGGVTASDSLTSSP